MEFYLNFRHKCHLILLISIFLSFIMIPAASASDDKEIPSIVDSNRSIVDSAIQEPDPPDRSIIDSAIEKPSPATILSDDKVKPSFVDSNLTAELVFRGLDFPTTMAFLGPDDILVLEKDKGTVQRITDGKMSEEALLDVDVSYMKERGMLGIAVAENNTINSNPYVFLYYTKSQTNEDEKIFNATYGVSNYLYRYELVNDTKLSNPKLLLSTPPSSEPWHNGGDMLIGPDNNVYLVIGDLSNAAYTHAQNLRNESLPSLVQNITLDTMGNIPEGILRPNLSGGILRVTQNGDPVGEGVIGNEHPLNLYYAYGIRNSFGIDFDPVTGNLWDEENGKDCCDEINLVEPGFNSGWLMVQGFWKTTKSLAFPDAKTGDTQNVDPAGEGIIGDKVLNPDNLEDFNGKGKYSSPEFIWIYEDACPTAIKFLSSDKYGKEYKNDLFVANTKGALWHFDLDRDRTGLVLKDNLEDKIAATNSNDELAQIKFGDNFGGITDIQVGPDGLLYILTLEGAIYRIVPQ